MRLLQDREDRSARFSVIIAELGENFDASEAAALRLEEALRKLFGLQPGTDGGGGSNGGGGGGGSWTTGPYGEPVYEEDPNNPDQPGGPVAREPGDKGDLGPDGYPRNGSAIWQRSPVDKNDDDLDDATGIPVIEWWKHYHGGGEVRPTGQPSGIMPGDVRAILEEGEYVVPKGGTLVMQENERTVILLEKILFAIEDQGGKITFLVNNPEKAEGAYGKYFDAAYNYR